MDVTGIDVGDVFRDKDDRLWTCTEKNDATAVITNTAGRTRTIPIAVVSTQDFMRKYRFMWSEQSPGIIQTSKGLPAEGS